MFKRLFQIFFVILLLVSCTSKQTVLEGSAKSLYELIETNHYEVISKSIFNNLVQVSVKSDIPVVSGGYQKAEEYAIVERLGYGITLNQDFGDLGKHKLNVSTFFKDTTSLSNSVITDRGKTKKSDDLF